MPRKIEIVFEKGGRLVAELYDEEAPETCNYFCERLPFTLPARRSVMSGGIIGVNLEGWNFNKLEYVNTMIPAGEIGFLSTFIPHRPMNNPYCQMLIPMSGRSQVHQMWGIASPTNRMGKIIEGLENLRAIGNRIANEGANGENCTVRLLE
jgi:hypothetical protein